MINYFINKITQSAYFIEPLVPEMAKSNLSSRCLEHTGNHSGRRLRQISKDMNTNQSIFG